MSKGADAPDLIARRYLAAFDTADPEVIAALVSDDFANVHTSALGSGSTGRDAYRARLPGFLSSFPDLHYEVERTVTEGSTVCAPYRLRATVEGRAIDLPGLMLLETDGGLIARRVDYWDSLGFLDQAGLSVPDRS